MVCRPRPPYRRLFLLLWIALWAAGCCRSPALASHAKNSSFVQHCPRATHRHTALSQLKSMIERALPHTQFPPIRDPPTCLDGDSEHPLGCHACSATSGLCAPHLSEHRLRAARRLYLQHCPHLSLFSVMSSEDRRNLHDTTLCCTIGRHLVERDQLVLRFLQQQQRLIERTNYLDRCHLGRGVLDMCGKNPYGQCVTCKEAYRRWVCSQLFVFYDGAGCPVKPCPSLCHCVEQNCPYFLPQDKPVAGEPSFLCGDPGVGMNDAVPPGDECGDRCYEPCSHNVSLGRLSEKTNATDFALCIEEQKAVQSCSKPDGGDSQCLARPISSIRNCAASEDGALARIRTSVLLLVSLTLFLQLPRGYT